MGGAVNNTNTLDGGVGRRGAGRGVLACDGNTASRASAAPAVQESRIVVHAERVDGPDPKDGEMGGCAQRQRGVACGGAIAPVAIAAPAAREARIVVWALRDAAARVVQEVVRCYARKMWGKRNRRLQQPKSATEGGEVGEDSSRHVVTTDGTSTSQELFPGVFGSNDGGQTWVEEFFGPESGFGNGQARGEDGDNPEIRLENGQRHDRPATVRSAESRRGTPSGGLLLLCSASNSDREGGDRGGAPSRTMTPSPGTEGISAPSRAMTASSGTGSAARVSTSATREATREMGRTAPSTGRASAGARDSRSCYGTVRKRGHVLVCVCRSLLTIDHASFSRRSAVGGCMHSCHAWP